jgi:ATP-dependent RNA helicase RhlE
VLLIRTIESSHLSSFHDFGLAEPITRALAEEKYVTPTPIQTQTIPIALSGRDVIGIAQTGTGKTAAFALPILHHLFTNRRRPERKTCRVLVLSPTRELSGQILNSFRTYGRGSFPVSNCSDERTASDPLGRPITALSCSGPTTMVRDQHWRRKWLQVP